MRKAPSPEGPKTFAGFALPTSNTTYTPNQFFDVCLPHSSRGAVRLVGYLTVRDLAGMILRCGLLNPEYENLAVYCWSIFSDEDQTGDRQRMFGGTARIKKVFGRPVKIHFIGVWDTVSTFGWIWDLLTVPNTDKNPDVAHLRQALSIDERRSCFEPIAFDRQPGQSIKEVWFPGAHADVGGGYPPKDGGLARISLEWMLNEAVECGLKIDRSQAAEQLHTLKDTPVPCEYAQIHNESARLRWRIQSWFPKRGFDKRQRRYRWTWPNWAHRRSIPPGANVHEATVIRMGRSALRYCPQLPADHVIIRTVPCAELTGLLRQPASSPTIILGDLHSNLPTHHNST